MYIRPIFLYDSHNLGATLENFLVKAILFEIAAAVVA